MQKRNSRATHFSEILIYTFSILCYSEILLFLCIFKIGQVKEVSGWCFVLYSIEWKHILIASINTSEEKVMTGNKRQEDSSILYPALMEKKGDKNKPTNPLPGSNLATCCYVNKLSNLR